MVRLVWLGVLLGCAGPSDGGEVLTLRWVSSDAGADLGQGRAAVAHGLGAVGAVLDPDDLLVLDRWPESALFALALDDLSLDPEARVALGEVTDALADAGEIEAFGGVDVGRLLAATLADPWAVYAVTGACETVDEWRFGRDLSFHHPVTTSNLMDGHRRIERGAPAGALDGAWVAVDGPGSLVAGTFEPRTTDVIDILPNGRLRFASYDADGWLRAGHAPAGGPSRCAWCHEDQLHVISTQVDLSGYTPWAEGLEEMARQQAAIEARRRELGWSGDLQEHAHTEVLIDAFLEPDALRLASEWGVSAEVVRQVLAEAGLAPHTTTAWPAPGPVWSRAELDARWAELVGAAWQVEGRGADVPLLDRLRPVPVPPSSRPVEPATPRDGRTWTACR